MANMFQFGYQPFDDARSYLRPFAIHRQRMIRLGHDSVPNTNYKREIELYPYFTGKKWYPCDVGTVTIPINRGEEGGEAETRLMKISAPTMPKGWYPHQFPEYGANIETRSKTNGSFRADILRAEFLFDVTTRNIQPRWSVYQPWYIQTRGKPLKGLNRDKDFTIDDPRSP